MIIVLAMGEPELMTVETIAMKFRANLVELQKDLQAF